MTFATGSDIDRRVGRAANGILEFVGGDQDEETNRTALA